MAGRILTLQRQARELGRLRAGWTEPYTDKYGKEKIRPVKSTTWLLSSPQREYLDVAAEMWGGEVHEWQPQGNGPKVWRIITEAAAIDAILPPGDPLSQSYEMWSRGGCQRRCDGEVESLSKKPCLCRAQFGDEFHLQKPEDACRPHTRLSVILPDLPDLGVWRMETHGFYAANEVPAAVDLIQHATGGRLAVPIRLRIEPRTRIAQGKTKHYPVIVVEIRGATAGQILSGSAPAIELTGGQQPAELGGRQQQRAIEAGQAQQNGNGAVKKTAEQYLALVKLCKNVEQVRALWRDAAADGVLTGQLAKALEAKSAEFKNGGKPAAEQPASAPEPAVEGEVEPDPDAVWAQINSVAGAQGWNGPALEEKVISHLGKSSIDANGFELQRFLDALKNGEVT